MKLRKFVTSATAAIERIAGKNSEYYKNIPTDKISSQLAVHGFGISLIPTLTGVLESLCEAVDRGLLTTIESRLRANIHDDFLEQASELLNADYHVAALVLTGGVLENHLCKMAQSRNLTCLGNGSISKYNDLLRENAYNQPLWRRIQSIGDLRNDAAHGDGASINPEDAKEAHAFIQRFIVDHPA